MSSFFEEAQELFPYCQAVRRDLHENPELGFQEKRTAGIIAAQLTETGLEVIPGIAGTGVIGILEGSRPGPVVLVRFDMDALPVEEQTGAAYASKVKGKMHACGHDGHVAIGLTTARILAAHRGALPGTVKFVFQPAEEGLGGAERMIVEGVLENPKPDFALALHIWNEKPLGWMGITPGPVMAAADIFKVTIRGKGGHGAIPEKTVDPVYACAQIVSTLQSVVSRNVAPKDAAVLSVTQIHAGDAFNVIPSIGEFSGTIRTYDEDVRATIMDRFKTIVDSLAVGLGCEARIEIDRLTPALINHVGITAVVAEVASGQFKNVSIDQQYRTMGSEDMAFMLQQVPGCYFFIGSANQEKGLTFGHHHPKFDFDESVLPVGAGMMATVVKEILARSGK